MRGEEAATIYRLGSPLVDGDQRKSVPPRHMRWRMTAILRASATRARLAPARLAIRRPHDFRAEGARTRVSKALAAS